MRQLHWVEIVQNETEHRNLWLINSNFGVRVWDIAKVSSETDLKDAEDFAYFYYYIIDTVTKLQIFTISKHFKVYSLVFRTH